METEMSYFCDKTSASYWSVCSKYAPLPPCNNENRYAVAMLFYRRIYANQLDRIQTMSPVADRIHSYFEVLGRSYHRDRCLKEKGRLFTMDTTGRIQFDTSYNFNVVLEGYEVSMVVDGLGDVSVTELYVSMLKRFCSERFNELQVVALDKNRLVLYMPGTMYEFFSSYAQIYFDKYAMRTGSFDMSIYYSVKYHDPERTVRTKDYSAGIARSLSEVLDYLSFKSAPSSNMISYKISLDNLTELVDEDGSRRGIVN